LTLLAEQVPDADARRRILWDTPVREFGLGSPQVAERGPRGSFSSLDRGVNDAQ
jgi:hypothetical protein